MARNAVQYQQGLSLQKFLNLYRSKAQRHQAFSEQRWTDGFKYPNCGHNRYCILKSRKFFQCNKCRSQISITARTIFESTKPPLTTWFLGIYLITHPKHFPRYFAEFCYRFNCRFDLQKFVPRFVYVALRTPPMSYRQVKMTEFYT